MEALIHTLIKRPYVFLFLAGFLFLAIRHIGLVRTLIWLVVGYLIAFASEYSSIHNGFPYGEYHYIYENLQGELLLAGVPVWDSVSYSFMTYASFAAASYAMPKAKLWKLWLAGAGLTTLLDVITDPVAKLGKQWFLGEIYYYAHDGWYFNVPFSNFAGWFFVAAAIIGVNLLIFKNIKKASHPRESGNLVNSRELDPCLRRDDTLQFHRGDMPCWLHLVFYTSICLFNTAIAYIVKAYLLGTVNLTITAIVVVFLLLARKRNLNK